MRNMTHVPPILELAEVLSKVLPADMNVRAVDPALKLRPKAFDAVDASTGFRGVDARFVIHRDMAIAVHPKVFIATELVGVDRGAGKDMLIDKRVHGGLGAPLNDAGNQFAVTLQPCQSHRSCCPCSPRPSR